MSHLSLHFLGEPAVSHAGQPLRFPTRKTLALLVYLAVEQGLHTRELLTALLWPESDLRQGRAALRNTLNYLRHALDDRAAPHLRIAREALGFDIAGDHTLDLHALTSAARYVDAPAEKLQTALALYRSDFLTGFSLSDAPEFDRWAAIQREHWHQQAQQVCERLAAQQRTTGDIAGALETLRRWLAINPLHEPIYQQLMQLYLAAGDREAARRTYEACRAMLAQEFGAEPAPEIQALAQVIRMPSTPVGLRPLADPAQLDIPLVGREQEFMRLIECYSSVRRANAQTVCLEGETGVGKTRLANEFLDWAATQGADVVRGRAFEAGGRLPYQPIVDAWRERLDRENAPDDLLADVWLAELSRLFPELRERYPDLAPPTGDDLTAQSRLYEAIARLGAALAARSPLIFFIDDLQWADAATLDLLHYAVRRWRESGVPLLLLFTIRAETLHPRAPFTTWLAALERETQILRMRLPPLTAEAIQRLIGQLATAAAVDSNAADPYSPDHMRRFADWLARESGGSPFFITELLKSLQDRGLAALRREGGEAVLTIAHALLEQPSMHSMLPPGVRDVIRARLFQLDPDAFGVLLAGAVLGQNFTFEQLCEVAGFQEQIGLLALDELLARHLIQPVQRDATLANNQQYTFSHDKLRDVAYTEAGDERRQRFHRRALSALERGNMPPALLAHHALAGRQPEAAFRYSVAAGDAALRLFAVRTAVAHYEQARQLIAAREDSTRSESGDGDPTIYAGMSLQHLYLSLGRAYELLNQMESARGLYQSLLALARSSGSATLECLALNRLATLAAQSDMNLDLSRTLLREAQAVAEQHGDTAGLAETEWNLAQLGVYSWDTQSTLTHGQRALELARALEHEDLIARCLNVLALGYSDSGQCRRMEQFAREAAQIYARLGNQAMEADCLSLVANALVLAGQHAAGIEQGWRAISIVRAIGSPWGQVSATIHLAAGLLDAGNYAEALELAREGAQLAHAHQIAALLPYILVVLGDVERALLQMDAASAIHLDALAADAAIASRPFAEMIHSALCADYACVGDWGSAHTHARQALAHRRYDALYLGLTRWHETEALLRGGDEETARADAARFGALIADDDHGADNPRFQLPYRRCLAVLAAWEGDASQSIVHLNAALTLADEMQLPGEQWPILVALAALYMATGEGAQAEKRHRQAVKIGHWLGDQLDDSEAREKFSRAVSHYL